MPVIGSSVGPSLAAHRKGNITAVQFKREQTGRSFQTDRATCKPQHVDVVHTAPQAGPHSCTLTPTGQPSHTSVKKIPGKYHDQNEKRPPQEYQGDRFQCAVRIQRTSMHAAGCAKASGLNVNNTTQPIPASDRLTDYQH
jgi:hypothetical protein